MAKEILKLIDIRKEFSNNEVVLKKINISINEGEFVTILGPSGCGKTTLLKLLAGFEMPTSGWILYKGIDIKNTPIDNRPTATVFQDYALFPNMTVRQNIEYGLKVMRTNKEEIPQNLFHKADKIYRDAVKESNNKIKSIKKQMSNIKKDLEKCDAEYLKKKGWSEIKKMRLNQYLKTIKKIKNEMYKTLGEDFTSKQTSANIIKGYLNTLLLKFNLSYRFSISTKNMNEYEREINRLTKIFSAKKNLDKKYDYLKDKYNELDYEVSYWENYPLLTKEKFVDNNITRKLTKEEIHKKASKVIDLVALKNKDNLMPSELSGGMQQRVALARSIVIEPKILLLDEPLSALDAKVRKQMQDEMKRLHDELGITFILVTHDQEEALSLSDKVIVINQGVIEQVGTPNEIYDTPSNKWVANFIGRANLFKGIYQNEKVDFLGVTMQPLKEYKFKDKSKVEVMIRPEDFEVVSEKKGFIKVLVESVDYKGLLWDIKCRFNNMTIFVEGINKVEVGKTIGLKWSMDDVHLIRR